VKILIEKNLRRLTVQNDARSVVFACKAALGSHPEGPKQCEGDGRTPEGEYYVCLKKTGKFGLALGVSYPNSADALRLGADEQLTAYIRECEKHKKRPPWGTPMGGEIYIHGGGTASDWTAGCIALADEDMERVYALCAEGDGITIIP